jgi:poly-gamma-glutamate capsule biosynthesis protein CapA/YwtB (metallophosphatase superfamily)
VLAVTGGAPLAVNLEGVLLGEPVVGLPAESHVMQIETAGPMLQRLNVVAAGLANNHSQDLGAEGLDASRAALSALGILPLVHGEIGDLGAFRVLPLTFHRGRFAGPGAIETEADLEAACARAADPPLVALVHWGAEYTEAPTDAERDAAIRLNACGVSLVVGAHSHKASPRIESLAGGATQMVFSLGNFLFDQVSERSSGALLEVRVFRQGTIAARLVPIPNLFEVGGTHPPTS